MKIVILFLFSFKLYADLPQSAKDVEIIKVKDEISYSNFPTISKTFEGVYNSTDTSKIESDCQNWIIDQLTNRNTPVYKAYCVRQKDNIIRQYNYIGKILIKIWP